MNFLVVKYILRRFGPWTFFSLMMKHSTTELDLNSETVIEGVMLGDDKGTRKTQGEYKVIQDGWVRQIEK